MKAIEIQRYAPGGDIYKVFVTRYGVPGANRLYQAALTGDWDNVLNVKSQLEGKGPISDAGTSTLGNFWNQITTNPLEAPLESANNQIGNAVMNVLKNPWVLATVAAIIFWQLGGFTWAKRKLGNA